LVAYLDGELPDAHSRAIATKLTMSATARREVEMLQKTWELLEQLDRPKLPAQFTVKTLSEIRRIELAGHAWEPLFSYWAGRAGRVLAALVMAAACAAIGFGLTRWVWPNPTERLVRDLTLAEHLDEYLEVGSFDFWNELVDSREFATDVP
jgi:anti-sigma factor RsiW